MRQALDAARSFLTGRCLCDAARITMCTPRDSSLSSRLTRLIHPHVRAPACSKEIDVSRLESCGSCTGSGIKAGTSASTCSTCGGSGQVVQAVRTPLGVFQQARPPFTLDTGFLGFYLGVQGQGSGLPALASL